MNRREMFDGWKVRKSQCDVSRGFSDRVMAGIRHRETAPAVRYLTPLLQYIRRRPWARAAVLILGALLGLVRIIATLHLVLFAS